MEVAGGSGQTLDATVGPTGDHTLGSQEQKQQQQQQQQRKRQYQRRPVKVVEERPERSLLCLGLKNPLRLTCIRIVEWK